MIKSFLAFILLPVHLLSAQSFKINDVIISDTTTSLTDPEIDWVSHHFVWASKEGVWVGKIDPQSGRFIPSNGKGILIDSTPSFTGMTVVKNGPEWAISKNGSVIIYPDSADSESKIQVGTAKLIDGNWVASPLPNSLNRIPFFGSYDENYIKDGITCASIDPVTMKGTGMKLRNTTDNSELSPSADLNGGRWIKGFYGVSLGNEKKVPYETGFFNANNSEYTKIAEFTNQIDQVWLVTMPEYNNLKVMWCVEKLVDQDEITTYALVNNKWIKSGSFRIPTDRKEIFSPEPFWWNGKTYLFLITRARDNQPRSLYPQVWIMSLDPDNKFFRMISEEKAAVRTDPEVYYTTSEPVIYYTETKANNLKVLHMCATGLNETKVIYPKAPFEQMTFTKDYFPGTLDKNGMYLGSTETMTIIAHKGKLFAGMGNWMDYPWQMNSSNEGSQVLRKDSYNSPWVVDTSFGFRSMRTDALLSVNFTKDANNNELKPAVNLLVCGAGDISIDRPRELNIWVRDDTKNKWLKNTGFTVTKGGTGIRAFSIHTDKVTGKQYLFCGMSEGDIIKAQYNTNKPGLLEIDTTRELRGLGRVMAMTVCNGDLYASAGVDIVGKDTVGGLFRRIDGAIPKWERVYTWPYIESASGGDEPNIMRGITTIPDPKGSGKDVIVGTRAFPGIVEIIEPHNNHNVYTEFYIKDFFSSQWNVNYKGAALSAYNYFVPDTLNGEEIWWQSLWVNHPDASKGHPYNGSHFLVRYKNGTYKYGDIFDDKNPLPKGLNLRACRTICKSPFKEEPFTYYFGGYDAAKDTSNNTSWIYKGRIDKFTSAANFNESIPTEFKLLQNYPNPFNPSTVIRYQISAISHVSLKVYDVLGREVATLVDEYKQPGFYSVEFRTKNLGLSSGIYFYQLKSSNSSYGIEQNYIETKKMMVLK
jgi:hypothetical protein